VLYMLFKLLKVILSRIQISVKELHLIFYVKDITIVAKVTSVVASFVVKVCRVGLIAGIINLDIEPLILVR